MKQALIALAILVAACGSTASYAQTHAGKKAKTAKTVVKYTCSMHPEVVTSKPGKCPKCGMKLVVQKTAAK
jgi:hypothetical protein